MAAGSLFCCPLRSARSSPWRSGARAAVIELVRTGGAPAPTLQASTAPEAGHVGRLHPSSTSLACTLRPGHLHCLPSEHVASRWAAGLPGQTRARGGRFVSRGTRLGLLGVAVVIAIVAVVIASSGGSDNKDKSNERKHGQHVDGRDDREASGASSSRTASRSAESGRSTSRRGPVRFAVASDVADEIHVHGYDFQKDVAAGGTVTFNFPANDRREASRSSSRTRKEQIAALKVRAVSQASAGWRRRARSRCSARGLGPARPPRTGSSGEPTCRCRRGCSAGRRRSSSSSRSSRWRTLWPQAAPPGAASGGACSGCRAWSTSLCGAIGVGALRRWSSTAGSRARKEPTANFAPTFIYVHFWVGLVVASVLLGDVFRAFNPWLAVGRAASLGGAANSRRAAAAGAVDYPAWLGRWPAVLGILGFAWLELAYINKDDPSTLAILALGYAAMQLVGMAVFGVERWSRDGRRLRRLLQPLQPAVAVRAREPGAVPAPAALGRAAAARSCRAASRCCASRSARRPSTASRTGRSGRRSRPTSRTSSRDLGAGELRRDPVGVDRRAARLRAGRVALLLPGRHGDADGRRGPQRARAGAAASCTR